MSCTEFILYSVLTLEAVQRSGSYHFCSPPCISSWILAYSWAEPVIFFGIAAPWEHLPFQFLFCWSNFLDFSHPLNSQPPVESYFLRCVLMCILLNGNSYCHFLPPTNAHGSVSVVSVLWLMLTALLIEYCLQIVAEHYKDIKGKAELKGF